MKRDIILFTTLIFSLLAVTACGGVPGGSRRSCPHTRCPP